MNKSKLPQERMDELFSILQKRFEKNLNRHPKIEWDEVRKKLEASADKLWSVNEMEETGGEPDVVTLPGYKNQIVFVDCSAETPKGRRSICYDQDALESRKEHKPKDSAINMAKEMGIKILNEEEYAELQKFGKFDNKTSSWLETPREIRELGGAIFGDFRFGRTFTYHNGAESYYGVRGFRGLITL